MAKWKCVFCFIFIANVGICGFIANDLIQEVFLKNEFATDQICPLDHDRPIKNVADTVHHKKLKGQLSLAEKEILETDEEKILNLEDNVLNTLKVVLKKVKDEITEESSQFIDENKRKSLIQPIALQPTDDSVPDHSNEDEKEDKSTTDSITANDSVVSDSLESSPSIKVVKAQSMDHESADSKEEAGLLEKLKALDSKFMSRDAQNEQGEVKSQQVVAPLPDHEQMQSEPLNRSIGTTSQTQNYVERPSAPWVPPKTSLDISKATLSEEDQQEPQASDGERENASSPPPIEEAKMDEEVSPPANETEAPELPSPEGNATSDSGLVPSTKETTPPGETPDDAQKDLLETYSQFAERVTAEKKNGASSSNGHPANGQLAKGPKVKTKNYASTDCGAKFITANPESSHSHKIMNSNKDEYMLNKCTGKIWAIVELCESIRPQKFDIANFELFSNSPKDIFLFGSHRYPTREWSSLGAYEGEEGNRDVQSFSVDTQEFFKFIKLEIHSYYGTEFFCPLSAFKIYGLSEFEVIEDTEDVDDDQLVIDEVIPEEPKAEESKDKPGMIPDVIKSVVSGVLEVIKRGSRSGNMTNEPEMNTFTQSCRSLSANLAIPEKCPFAESLNYILACYYDEYMKLISRPVIASVIQNDDFCCRLATVVCASPKTDDSLVYDSVCNNSYACVMLSPKHVLAMCHMYNTSALWEPMSCTPESGAFHPAHLNLSSQIKKAENSLMDDQSSTSSQDVTQTDVTPDQPAVVIVDEQGSQAVSPSSGSVLPRPPPGQATEANEIHLPHIDPKPKVSIDPLKKTKEPSFSSPPETSPNATLATIDKATSHNADKKERKGVKESAEKTHASDDAHLGTPGNVPSTPIPPTTATEGRVGSHPNKESVVVRLSNKIKVLEHNMSISSQYLEELSRRYKRQMEDMQRQFNITILALNSTSQTAYERDLYHQKRLETLENHLEKMSITVSLLVEEKESILTRVVEQHMILLFVELVLMFLVFSFLMRRRREDAPRPPVLVSHVDKVELVPRWGGLSPSSGEGRETPSLSRRRSVDSIRSDIEGKTKERRLSGDLAMKGSYKDLLITTTTTTKEKKRKKKKNHLKRSLSNASFPEKERLPSASKKDKKLEKLKRSSAGVLFSGEGGGGEGYGAERGGEGYGGKLNGHFAKEDSPAEWHIMKKGKGKSKLEPGSLAEPYAFSSDLKRGKIILDKDPGGSIYPQQYYTEMPFAHGMLYGGECFDIESEDMSLYNYHSEVTSPTQSFNDAYLSDVRYGAPVVNDYYRTREMLCYPATKKTSVQESSRLEDSVDGSVWETTKSPGVLVKSPSSIEFRSPTSFKGRTKLRSDNWEWYSSQPSRLTSSNCAAEVISNSSSDSSVKSKAPIKGTKNETIKLEKKKKKKCKALKLVNGNGP